MSLGYLSVSAFVVRARHSGPLGGVHNAQQSSRSRRVLRHITLMASHEKNTGDSNGNSEDRDASTRQPDDVNSQQGDASSGPKMGRRSIAIPLAARDPARVFMFAGLLKILQLSLPGGSAGMLVMASAHLAWGMQPGVFLGIVSACVGLGLAYVGQKLVKSGRADNPWVLRGLGIGTLLFVGIMARRGQIHMIRTLAMQHAQEQRILEKAQERKAAKTQRILQQPDTGFRNRNGTGAAKPLVESHGVSKEAFDKIYEAMKKGK